MLDDTFLALINKTLALIEGLEGSYKCSCGRYYRVGNSAELSRTVRQIKGILATHNVVEVTPDTTRFALIEIDNDN
jgi:hypothetical protein